jgi:CheY-like chemotaxis protein
MDPPHTAPSVPARIAVLDDDPLVVEILQVALAEEGYDVRAAREPAEGYAMVSEWRPDLVILDLISPARPRGLALLDQLKQDPALWDIPVIVCTAVTLDSVQQETLLLGHRIQFVPKPFELDALLGTVRAALHDTRR